MASKVFMMLVVLQFKNANRIIFYTMLLGEDGQTSGKQPEIPDECAALAVRFRAYRQTCLLSDQASYQLRKQGRTFLQINYQ